MTAAETLKPPWRTPVALPQTTARAPSLRSLCFADLLAHLGLSESSRTASELVELLRTHELPAPLLRALVDAMPWRHTLDAELFEEICLHPTLEPSAVMRLVQKALVTGWREERYLHPHRDLHPLAEAAWARLICCPELRFVRDAALETSMYVSLEQAHVAFTLLQGRVAAMGPLYVSQHVGQLVEDAFTDASLLLTP